MDKPSFKPRMSTKSMLAYTLSYVLFCRYRYSLKITNTLTEEIKSYRKYQSNADRCTDATACARCYRRQKKGFATLGVGENTGSQYGEKMVPTPKNTRVPR